MGPGAVGVGGRVVRGGADERVAEADDVAVEPQDAAALRRSQRGLRDPERGQGPEQPRDRVVVHRRRDAQRAAAVVGQAGDLLREGALEGGPGSRGPVERGTTTALLDRQEAGELQQRQRVAARGPQQVAGQGRREVRRVARHQDAGGGLVERGEHVLVEPGGLGVSARGARGREERDPESGHAPGDEEQRLPRSGVDPLEVVDHDDDRRPDGGLAQQPEQRGGHREAVVRARRLEAQRRGERTLLRVGQQVEQRHDGRGQRPQHRERQRRLRLHAGRPQDRAAPGALGGDVGERGLADPWVAAEDQRRPAGRADGREPLVDDAELAVPADEGLRRHRPSLRSRTGGAQAGRGSPPVPIRRRGPRRRTSPAASASAARACGRSRSGGARRSSG